MSEIDLTKNQLIAFVILLIIASSGVGFIVGISYANMQSEEEQTYAIKVIMDYDGQNEYFGYDYDLFYAAVYTVVDLVTSITYILEDEFTIEHDYETDLSYDGISTNRWNLTRFMMMNLLIVLRPTWIDEQVNYNIEVDFDTIEWSLSTTKGIYREADFNLHNGFLDFDITLQMVGGS